MSVEPPVSVEQYLSTAYDPDVEYVDGELVERSVGGWLHSLVQSNIIFALRRKYAGLKVVAELRSQTTETRYRLPDVSVLRLAPRTRYLLDAPFIAIEILSEEDRMTKVIEKLLEYEAKGVPNIWVIDPRLRRMSVFRAGALVAVSEDSLRTQCGEVEITREELFQD